MNMTAKPFPKLDTIPDRNPGPSAGPLGTMPAAPFTWEKLAGHWLRSPAANADESDAATRRQAAVRRWRGLHPESTCCP